LDFESFIEQNPHEEKRDPNSRSTLHHSLGPRGTHIPLGGGHPGSGDSRSRRVLPSWTLSRSRDCRLSGSANSHLNRWSRSDRSRRLVRNRQNQVPISSDNSPLDFHRELFLATGLFYMTRDSRLARESNWLGRKQPSHDNQNCSSRDAPRLEKNLLISGFTSI
jgi:hypothetical protein